MIQNQEKPNKKLYIMKKNLSIIILFLISSSVFCQDLIDQRAATVNLTKPEIISRKKLDQTVEILKRNGIDKSHREVLETMVGDILLQQGAEREGISVSDKDVLNLIRNQIGKSSTGMSDSQIKDFVRKQTGVSWEKYSEKSRETIQLQKYVNKVKKDKLSNIPRPSEKEIQKFYDENSIKFSMPKTVRFDHIFIDTRMLSKPEDMEKATQRADSYLKELRNGSKTFDQLVENSDDSASKYNKGDFGYLRINDLPRKKLLGELFFDSVFSLKKEQISDVIKSNMGYHIVRLKEIIDPHVLGIDEKINPSVDKTVRERIEDYLMMKTQEDLFKESVKELVEELEEEAEIKYYL